MSRSRKLLFLPIFCPVFDIAAPTQTFQTCSRSQVTAAEMQGRRKNLLAGDKKAADSDIYHPPFSEGM